jgi:hypothetical protein
LTGLGPIQRVRKQSARKVDNMTFQQTISWRKVMSNHQNIKHYSIRYEEFSKVKNYTSIGITNITSTTNSITLTLPLPTSPITYNVWVAAVGEKTGVGEYSHVLQLKYSGNFKYCTVTKMVGDDLHSHW